MGFELGIQERPVTGDLEGPRSTGGDLDSFAILYKQVPRTERTRLVVSDLAEFDMDGHIREYLFPGCVLLIWSRVDVKQRGPSTDGLT